MPVFLFFSNVLYIQYNHCMTQAGRLLGECIALALKLAAQIILHKVIVCFCTQENVIEPVVMKGFF